MGGGGGGQATQASNAQTLRKTVKVNSQEKVKVKKLTANWRPHYIYIYI